MHVVYADFRRRLSIPDIRSERLQAQAQLLVHLINLLDALQILILLMIQLGCALLPCFERSAPRFNLLPFKPLLFIHEILARRAARAPNLVLLLDHLFVPGCYGICALLLEESLVLCRSTATLDAHPLALGYVRSILLLRSRILLHDSLLAGNVRLVLGLCEGCRELIVALDHLVLHSGVLLIDGENWVIVRLKVALRRLVRLRVEVTVLAAPRQHTKHHIREKHPR